MRLLQGFWESGIMPIELPYKYFFIAGILPVYGKDI